MSYTDDDMEEEIKIQKRGREEEIENFEFKKSKQLFLPTIIDQWVKGFDESIIEFYSLPMDRFKVKSILKKLSVDKKKYIFEMILHSPAFKKLTDDDQRKQLIQILQNLSV